MKLFKPFKIDLALGVMFVFLGLMGCETEPVKIIAEANQSCKFSNVECGAGLECVSHYDGGQMLCKAPCQVDASCSGDQVCDPAPQITATETATAPLVCQAACTSLAGSGCGGDMGAPNAIVKWEVAEVDGQYNMRGINADGNAYLDATIAWYGDETFTVEFTSPEMCKTTMSIAEATVYTNTCGDEAALAISTVGIDLWTDMESQLNGLDDDKNFLDKACPWVIGGFGITSVLYVGTLTGAVIGAGVAGASMGAAYTAVAAGAWPVIPAFFTAATGCWIYGNVTDHASMAECVGGCSFGNTPCVEECIYDELQDDQVGTGVLLPQCMFACQEGDDACLSACGYYLQ